jgi:hypothetical protein
VNNAKNTLNSMSAYDTNKSEREEDVFVAVREDGQRSFDDNAAA